MNEFDFIKTKLSPLVQHAGADQLSDDVALLPTPDKNIIVTTDTIVETVHFRSSDPLDTVAQKLVRVNVSDCLAKGALPYACLLNLTWDKERSVEDLDQFVSGLETDLQTFRIGLLGGDTTSSKSELVLSLTLFGQCINSSGPIRRSGAAEHEDIWVSGTIGDSFLGLHNEGNDRTEYTKYLATAYLVPQLPHLKTADLIARYATASLDVSDGLIADAGHIAETSGVACHIEAGKIPVSEPAKAVISQSEAQFSLTDLITGGDDYQSLFTASDEDRTAIERFAKAQGIVLTRIGRTLAGQGVALLDENGRVQKSVKSGWKHTL